MKACLFAACVCTAAFHVQSAIFEFDIQPGGLSSSNQRPNPVFSTAGGNELPTLPTISLDTGNHTLFLNVAWGSINGFTDLAAPFAVAHIRGPATTSGTGSLVYNITSLVQQQTPTDGGVFGMTLSLVDRPSYTVAQQEADLLNSKWYLSVYSQKDSIVEIRGQLTLVPEPEAYVLLAGFGLVSFAAYRRLKNARIPTSVS